MGFHPKYLLGNPLGLGLASLFLLPIVSPNSLNLYLGPRPRSSLNINSSYSSPPKKISERERDLLPIIENLAIQLDFSKFVSDPILLQTPPATGYIDPKRNNLIFNRKTDGDAKQAIALSSRDTASWAIPTPRGGKKRQFILLRKALSQVDTESEKGVPYYSSFVYIRNRLDSDNETISNEFLIHGVPSVAEWDIWEDRKARFYGGWESCDFTLYFTCSSLKAMAGDAVKALIDAERKSRQNLRRRKRSPNPMGIFNDVDDDDDEYEWEELEALIPMQGVDNHDPNEYNDLYLDLDFHRFDEQEIYHLSGSTRNKRSVNLHPRFKRHGWPAPYEGDNVLGGDDDDVEIVMPGGRTLIKAKPENEATAGGAANINALMKNLLGTEDDSKIKLAMTVLSGMMAPNAPLDGLLNSGGNLTNGVEEEEKEIAEKIRAVLSGPYIGMLKSFLGPSGGILEPLINVVGSGADLVRHLPEMPENVGHELRGAMSNIAAAMGIEGFLDTLGLAGILENITTKSEDGGAAGKLSAWESLGHIDATVKDLNKVGISLQLATMKAFGDYLSTEAAALGAKGTFSAWHLGSDTVGAALNGGTKIRAGMREGAGVATNAGLLHGIIFPGAGTKKQFFFPEQSMTFANFVSLGEGTRTLHGLYEPGLPGKPHGFYADDEAAAAKFEGQRGRIVPDGYKTKQGGDGGDGIVGTFSSSTNSFHPEGVSRRALLDPTDVLMKEKFWFSENAKPPSRPGKDRADPPNTILYGALFPGIIDSPHVFIAEGESLTGFFVPDDDEDHPQYTQTPHGIFSSTQPAGHATFVAESPEEIENIKELHGVFIPDGMQLGGGIGGELMRVEGGQSSARFSFVADRPALDFMYIPGNSDAKNVWNSYLSKQEWKHSPPPIPPVPPPAPPPAPMGRSLARQLQMQRGRGLGNEGGSLEVVSEDKIYGVRIMTKKNVVFLPLTTPIKGKLVLMDLENRWVNHGAFIVMVKAERPDTPFKVEIVKEEREADEKPKKAVLGLFKPKEFPTGDAIIGMYDPAKGLFTPLPETAKPHFWSASENVWIPVELKPRGRTIQLPYTKRSGKKKKAGPRVPVKRKINMQGRMLLMKNGRKKRDVEATAAEEQSQVQLEEWDELVPGVTTFSVAAPEKLKNYRFGPLYDNTVPEMVEDVVDTMPHEYIPGVFYIDAESPAPVFVADGGAMAVFEPDDEDPVAGWVFPHKGDKPPSFVLDTGDEEDTEPEEKFMEGKVGTVDRNGAPLRGYFKATLNGTKLKIDSTSEWVPGWLQTDLTGVEPQDLPSNAKISIANFKRTKRVLKYALVDIGGGFQGVVIEGQEALNDANNPIFQQYLHYRAQRNGDVNPWGHTYILDPITNVGDRPGAFMNTFNMEEGPFAQLAKGFSLNNWVYLKISQVMNGFQLAPLKVSDRWNIVSMLDFRAFLYKKYTCKLAKSSGNDSLYILTPLAAEPFLTLKSKAAPRKAYVNAIAKGPDKLVVPEEEGVAGIFAAQFGIEIDSVLALTQRAAGTPMLKIQNRTTKAATTIAKETEINDWKKSAPFETLGDKHTCDQITLDEFQIAQTLAATTYHGLEAEQDSVTGMDLGIRLVTSYANPVTYTDMAYNLLVNIKKKQAETKKSAGAKLKSTDLMGTTINKVAVTAGKLLELNQEVTYVASVEPTNEQRKRGVIRKGKKKPKPAGRSLDHLKLENVPELDLKGKHHSKSLRGWKTQHRPPVPNVTLSYSGVIFYGLGNCEQKEIPDISLWKSGEPFKVIQYYLKVLRTDCMEDASNRITELVNNGLLVIFGNDAFFRIPMYHKLTRTPRLTPREMKQLSLAFEFHAFTKTYHVLRTEKGFPSSGVIKESHGIISRSAGFLTELTYYILGKARRFSPEHSVRLTRNLLRTLRTIITKLQQDIIALKSCTECTFDRELIEGDKFRVMSLIQFIIHGLGPLEKDKREAKQLFLDFVKLNEGALKQRVTEFERQFPNSQHTTEQVAEKQVEEIKNYKG